MAKKRKMSKTDNRVKLYTYEKLPNETVIESFEAKCWDDFVLVQMPLDRNDEAGMWSLYDNFEKCWPGKKIVLVPDTVDIHFYGVRLEEQEEGDRDD